MLVFGFYLAVFISLFFEPTVAPFMRTMFGLADTQKWESEQIDTQEMRNMRADGTAAEMYEYQGAEVEEKYQLLKAMSEEPNGPVSEENASETSTRVLSADKPMVALTYDDGPSPTATNAILDVLEEYAVVATFYDVGYRVAQYPEVVAREAALGCEVASHSYDHKDFCQLTAAQIRGSRICLFGRVRYADRNFSNVR